MSTRWLYDERGKLAELVHEDGTWSHKFGGDKVRTGLEIHR